MARKCMDQLKPFFTYLKIQLLFSYNSTDTKLAKTSRFSFVSLILLCSLLLLYMSTFVDFIGELFQDLQRNQIIETKLKTDALMLVLKCLLIILSLWVLPFSLKSRQILEDIVRHLQAADDLIGLKTDRTRTINCTVAGFICIKLVLILACSPFFTRGYPLFKLIVLFNEIFVNCMEDGVEHIFIVFCAEIVARLNCFKVLKKKKVNKCYATCTARMSRGTVYYRN